LQWSSLDIITLYKVVYTVVRDGILALQFRPKRRVQSDALIMFFFVIISWR